MSDFPTLFDVAWITAVVSANSWWFYRLGHAQGVEAEKIRACQAALDKAERLMREGRL